MFEIIQLYLIIVTLILAKKDAESYLLKVNTTSPSILKIIQRWHLDGVILVILINIPIGFDFLNLWWEIIIANILIRLSEFDLIFNHYAGLSITELGSTAKVDKFFTKIFGQQGALKKSMFFFIILILFNIAKLYFKF